MRPHQYKETIMNTPKQAIVKIVLVGIGTLALNVGARILIDKIASNVDYSK